MLVSCILLLGAASAREARLDPLALSPLLQGQNRLEPRNLLLKETPKPRVLWLRIDKADSCGLACSRSGLSAVSHQGAEMCAVFRDSIVGYGTTRPTTVQSGERTCQYVTFERGLPKVHSRPGLYCGCLPGKANETDAVVWTTTDTFACPEGYVLDRLRLCWATQGRNSYFGVEMKQSRGLSCAVYWPWNPAPDRQPYGAAMRTYKLLCVPTTFNYLNI